MRRCWRALGLVVAMAAACSTDAAGGAADGGGAASSTAGGDRVVVGQRERTYRVHTPPSVRGGPLPLVLVFHGSGGDGDRIRGFVGPEIESLADRHGFLVAYLDGHEGHWNDCRGAARFSAAVEEVDDVGFVRAVVGRLARAGRVDRRRVYALGFSNGGHMAYRLALEVPGEVRAVAAFGANLPVPEEVDCRPSGRPARVLVVNGTDDPINPFEGGAVRLPDGTALGRVLSAEATVRHFAELWPGAVTSREIVVEAPPDEGAGAAPAASGGRRVERLRWSEGGGDRVVLFAVHGGGHTIPGRRGQFPAFLGGVERRFEAVAEAVRFFTAAGGPGV